MCFKKTGGFPFFRWAFWLYTFFIWGKADADMYHFSNAEKQASEVTYITGEKTENRKKGQIKQGA